MSSIWHLASPVMSRRSLVAQVPEPLVPQSSVPIQSLLHWELGLAEKGCLLSPTLLSVQGQTLSFGVPSPP